MLRLEREADSPLGRQPANTTQYLGQPAGHSMPDPFLVDYAYDCSASSTHCLEGASAWRTAASLSIRRSHAEHPRAAVPRFCCRMKQPRPEASSTRVRPTQLRSGTPTSLWVPSGAGGATMRWEWSC